MDSLFLKHSIALSDLGLELHMHMKEKRLIIFLPVPHRSRNTCNGEGREGEGGRGSSIHPQVLLKNGFFGLIIYCLETVEFVVTTNWL